MFRYERKAYSMKCREKVNPGHLIRSIEPFVGRGGKASVVQPGTTGIRNIGDIRR